MADANHTSGPWAVNPMNARVDAFDSGKPIAVCELLWPTVMRSEAETEANGRLIAAAPDLLAAADRLWGSAIPRSERVEGPVTHYMVDRDEMMNLRAAIAKASGAA